MKTLLYGIMLFACSALVNVARSQWSVRNADPTFAHFIHSIQFLDGNMGYAVGEANAKGVIYKTANGGISFTQIYSTSADLEWIYDIHFTSAATGVAVGEHGTIFQTTDGGSGWSRQVFAGVSYFKSINFPTATVGYAVGRGSPGGAAIYKTTDGGTTWVAQTSTATSFLNCVFFLNANSGYTVGDVDILKTTNGGAMWSNISAGNTAYISSIYCVNDTTCYRAEGFHGAIKKTTNGGSSWATVFSDTAYYFTSIHFTDTNTGYAAGAGTLAKTGIILRTTNAGATWDVHYSTSQGYVDALSFVTADTAFAALNKPNVTGANHRVWILKTTNAGKPTDVERVSDVAPIQFALHQNYPNPFNPSTHIEYALAQGGFVTLKIYNLLGKEVATLVEDVKPAGHYTREWNADQLSGGIYFYRLALNGFTETKKLLLLK